MLRGERSDQPKVTNLNSAIRIHKNIGWFEIPMNYFTAMQVFKTLRYLINNVSDVNVLKDALSDDVVQISFHKLKH
jgi:hypothetical protein